jgi:short-subunit dehydrogenase
MARRPSSPDQGCAWVTGASSGIGAALVRELSHRGWRVAMTARRVDALEALARDAPDRLFAAPADVADRAAMARAHAATNARFGPVGLLIANAGVYLPVDARAPDADRFAQTFSVNLMGVVHALENVAPSMTARGVGHIHMVSSATGFGGMPTAGAYGASKAALYNMAETFRVELDPVGVGVSVSTPGFVDTPAQDDNAFPKPFQVTAETAARRIVDGVARGGFEITFPRRFTWPLKAIYALPPPLRLPLVRRWTGWDRKTL